jgi:oligopeptide/dipeptide ABC transporter ATP-binding protein
MSLILDIQDLTVHFRTTKGTVVAVDQLSMHIEDGETVAVVGESGCGKTTAALSILRLIPDPPGRIAGGRILFEGTDLLDLSDNDMRAVRGRQIAMIFQDPMMALNPVYTVGDQITEGLRLHLGMPKAKAMKRAVELLATVGIPEPGKRVREYPHNLSGGMRQRAMIAMALACDPKLLIADEPTTAVDVTVQAQILDLLRNLQKQLGMAMLLITHDLGVVSEIAERVVVMYAGRKVEEGTVEEVFRSPAHPYTDGLLASATLASADGRFLKEIPGTVPSPFDMPTGCNFALRCPKVFGKCHEEAPALESTNSHRKVACFAATELR